MQIEIPKSNWQVALADAIKLAVDGDVILCHSESMKEMAKLAKSRICPTKNLIFELDMGKYWKGQQNGIQVHKFSAACGSTGKEHECNSSLARR